MSFILTSDQVDSLVGQPDERKWHGRRDRLLLLLMVDHGLRVGEVCGLTRDCVVRLNDRTWLFLSKVKRTVDCGDGVRGSRFREVLLTDECASLLDDWLVNDFDDSSEFLFHTRNTVSNINPKDVWRRVQKHSRDSGVLVAKRGKNGSMSLTTPWPHLLRHTAISRMHQKGLNEVEIMRLVGHANIETTSIYLHYDTNELTNKFR